MDNDPLRLIDQARQANSVNDFDRAEMLLSLAIQQADKMPQDTRDYSTAQATFALWRFYQDRFAEAEIYQKRYMEAEHRLGIGQRELANLTMYLADMQQKQGKLDLAKQTIDNAINLYPRDCFSELSQAYEDLAAVLAQLRDPLGAASAKTKSVELRKEWEDITGARGCI
jgi:tetratricopeptide (TPR) repeat protein